MHIIDYITKAMNSRYWHTRVQFYVEFNGNVLTALREQGWNGKYMSAGDMKLKNVITELQLAHTKTAQTELWIGEYTVLQTDG